VRGKLFAWTARERDGGGLAVRVDRDEKQLLLDAHPEVYFTSPHYNGYPGIQIRLELIDREELAERLEDAWLIQAPKQLAKQFLADNPVGMRNPPLRVDLPCAGVAVVSRSSC
jgi:hypothetical protein